MNIIKLILVTLFLFGCKAGTDKNNQSEQGKADPITKQPDSILTFTYIRNIIDSSIINNAARTVDVLFNGVHGFAGGQENPKVRFRTECMMCEPLQFYNNGFLFAKRLYFGKDGARYYPNDIDIPDTLNQIRQFGYYGERKTMKLVFSTGVGTMNYQGQSCNDADFVAVDLKYDNGSIKVNKLINASFFEFDLDKDGRAEQYLLGTRNCSQELVLLRIK